MKSGKTLTKNMYFKSTKNKKTLKHKSEKNMQTTLNVKTTPKRMRNEKPSKLNNLGQDVAGAVRHNFDTYDNPEKRQERENAKKIKNAKTDLKQRAIDTLETCQELSEAKEILQRYELDSAIQTGKFPGYNPEHTPNMSELKFFVLNARTTKSSDEYNLMAKAYNRLSKVRSKISWSIGSMDKAREYLAPKQKSNFKEFNGVQKDWALNLGPFETFNAFEINSFLLSRTRAVQFGNSLTLEEREYCLKNLKDSIEMLSHKYIFDFQSLAFSFGARGKPGSIAHYQNSFKVLAFNRGWSGAFMHELGHAVDYSLDLPSSSIPWEIRKAYRQKLSKANLGPYMSYYMGEKEIFARLFEVYMREEFPAMTEFMQVTYSEAVMPDLDEQARDWMRSALAQLKK